MECMQDICIARNGKRRRLSSYDRTGGNADFIWVEPQSAVEFAAIEGAGIIRHIWVTTDCSEEFFLRKVLLEIRWDGEEQASVLTPLGDFFGLGHAYAKNFSSMPFQMSSKDGTGFNCWFPMPFFKSAKFTLRSECDSERLVFYFHIDYEEHELIPTDSLLFHAQWRRQNPTDGIPEDGLTNDEYNFTGGDNTTGDGNYVILEARGRGHYVGCHLDIENLRKTEKFDWYGEGDDMIFIDGDVWPPTLHGTGMEDYFCCAFGPGRGDEHCSPWHGIPMAGGENFKGKSSWYRYHVPDPVMFGESIRVTIEHGHANRRSDDYSSTAYWYQSEPHMAYGILPAEQRLPRQAGMIMDTGR